jgi:hypothetical protein
VVPDIFSLTIMIEIKITIESLNEGPTDLRMESIGKACNMDEVKLAQRIIRTVQGEVKHGIIEILIPPVESLVLSKDRPQPN